MEKKSYITVEEQKKCRKVADAFAELEDVDIVVVDAGRYGFVKLQYYTPPTGFENDSTFTDSKEMFEDLWEEWLHTQIIVLAREMGAGDIDYDNFFKRLPEEKQNEQPIPPEPLGRTELALAKRQLLLALADECLHIPAHQVRI